MKAAGSAGGETAERLVRFVPFDPATKIAEALVIGPDGGERRIVKGAFEMISKVAEPPAEARHLVDALAEQGHRVIAVAMGSPDALRLVGLIAISDPPRKDSAPLIAELDGMGVRTVMVTGDSAVTAAAIAREIGIAGAVCPPEQLSGELSTDQFGVFARVVPEGKYRLVKALQRHGHVVGMCGDGTNDAPALRQAQIGIAVSSATDVAKAAAGMVMTEPGLAGIVFAVREGRIGFQRLLTYTFNMLVKKVEIVLFLAIGLAVTGHAVLTPALMVLLFVTNDFLSMSLTTDRASFASVPQRMAHAQHHACRGRTGRVQAVLLQCNFGVGEISVRVWRRTIADAGVRHAGVWQSGRLVRAAGAGPALEFKARHMGAGGVRGRYRLDLAARVGRYLDGAGVMALAGRRARGDRGICADL